MAHHRSTKQLKLIDAPEPFAAGTTLGLYTLGNPVGQGSFCRVYQALHNAQRRLVAVKILIEPASQNSQTTQNSSTRRPKHLPSVGQSASLGLSLLQRESEVAQRVRHPHLLAVQDAHLDEPPYFLVLEWIEGATLEQLLARRRRLLPALALRLARHVAQALEALDEAGYVHGDLKPENILIDRRWQAKLGDLGMARQIERLPISNAPVKKMPRRTAPTPVWAMPGPHSVSPRSDSFWGTANYMAPELTTTYHKGDIRSDIYSLGVTLYQMLVGCRPFSDRDFFATLCAHRQALPEPARRRGTPLPPGVVSLLDQLLAKDPLRRPQTPGELIDLLRRQEIDAFDVV